MTLCFTKQTTCDTVPRVLSNVLEGQLDVEMPLGERVRMWYLHDGAPPHFAKPVTEGFNNYSLSQWSSGSVETAQ